MKIRKNLVLEKKTAKKLDILKINLEMKDYNELLKHFIKEESERIRNQYEIKRLTEINKRLENIIEKQRKEIYQLSKELNKNKEIPF